MLGVHAHRRRPPILRIAALLLGFCLGLPDPAGAAPAAAQLVMDAQSGRVVHHRQGDRPVHPASLTKLMTLYLLFEALDRGALALDTPLRVSAYAAGRPPSKLGLAPGSRLRVADAIPALTVRSANDVAVVVAEALAGSEPAFAKSMTAKARALGMERTVFRNASGLPDRRQVTTARDMARLAHALLRDFPHHYAHFGRASFTYAGRTFTSHNRVVATYDGCDGLKTGYVRMSGFNVALSARRGDQRWIVLVFGGTSAAARDARARELLDRAFGGRWGPAEPWRTRVLPLPPRKPPRHVPLPPAKPSDLAA